ncbi:UNVERIFIED_CONTAM: hypothetical protein H355_004511 [Colinus virginianus]|nr:hypothetical protein H355_004511 [Colinus virginianus]
MRGAKDGKGRGKQVIGVARTCSLILIVLDVMKPLTHKHIIERELEGFGIRLNKLPPNISFKKKDKGGISVTHTVPLTNIDEETIKSICHEYRITNAQISLRCDATADDVIDVIEGNRLYIPCLYVMNKIDQITIEELDLISRVPHYVPISAHHETNTRSITSPLKYTSTADWCVRFESIDLVRICVDVCTMATVKTTIKTELCSFSEYRIYPGRGQRFVAKDGKVHTFLFRKEASLFKQKTKPVKLHWTLSWRRMNKKGAKDALSKRRTRKPAKTLQKAIVGLSLEDIKRTRALKPEAKAKTTAAVKEAKEKAEKAKKPKAARPQQQQPGAKLPKLQNPKPRKQNVPRRK